MASIINADTSGGLKTTADTSGVLQLQSGGTTIATISSTGLAMNTGNITVASTAAPAFSAGQSASGTSVSAFTPTKITLDVEDFDTNNNFASSRFTPTVAGYYQINGTVNFSSAATYVFASLYKNGSEYKRGSQSGSASGSGNASQVASVIYFNGSTDYVELYGHSGISNTTNNNTAYTWLNGSFIRSA